MKPNHQVTIVLGIQLLSDYKDRVNLNFPFQAGDIRWSEEGVKRYPTLTFLAGLLAGLVGIGGGMVLGPLLLEIGMIPQVSSVSAALMVCFAASAAVVQYMMLGVYPFEYTLLYATVAFTGGWVGQVLVKAAVKKYNAVISILYCLNAVIGGAAILVGVDLVQTVMKHGFDMKVDDFCAAPAAGHRRLMDGVGEYTGWDNFGEALVGWGEGLF